jgi:hypothetical protein
MENLDLNELRRRLLTNQQRGTSDEDDAVYVNKDGNIIMGGRNRGEQNVSRVPDKTFAAI